MPTGSVTHILAVPPVRLTPAEIAENNASDADFAMSPGETIRAGLAVAEQLTTTFNNGSKQTESLLKASKSGTAYVDHQQDDHRAYGTVEHQQTITTDRGDLDSTSRTTTTLPGEIIVSTSATNVIRDRP